MAAEGHVTYRSVLANREFAALLLSQGLSVLGDQLARLAVALLVFQRTGSGLAASATFAISYTTYLIGGPMLSALSDRYPRLTVMVVCDLTRAPLVLLLCLPNAPLPAVFLCLGLTGLLSPPFDSARSGLQPDILQGDAYVTGNAFMNLVVQLGHVLGFVAGGALVAVVSTRAALALDAATFLLSAGALLAFIATRPAAQQPKDRQSLWRDTMSGFAVVRSSPEMRRYLMFGLLGSGALIAPEGLAVPVASELHGGAIAAGFLTATVPAGYVLGGIILLRFPAERRITLLFPLTLLSLVPLILTPFAPSLAAVSALWALAGVGGALQIVASSAYVQAAPANYRSRAFGVAITLLNVTQGVGLFISGLLADALAPSTAVAILAGVVLVLLLSKARGARDEQAFPQEDRNLVRGVQG